MVGGSASHYVVIELLTYHGASSLLISMKSSNVRVVNGAEVANFKLFIDRLFAFSKFLLLRANSVSLSQFLDGEQAFINLVSTRVHLIYEVHVLVAPVIKLIIIARVVHIGRLPYDQLTLVVYECALTTFKQSEQ